MCVTVWVSSSECPQRSRSEEGMGSLGARLISSGERPDLGAQEQMVLCMSSILTKPCHLPIPLIFFFFKQPMLERLTILFVYF